MGSLGFGHKSGVDLLGEAEGILPSREWKATRSKFGWFPGETVIAGIGQGYWNVTTLQLAHATATLADHGTPYAPRLVMATANVKERPVPLANPPSGPSVIRKAANWNVINQGMEAVIYGAGGTASQAGVFKDFPYTVAGKSGTAERFSRRGNEYDTNKNLAYLATRHRAWFIAYTPTDAPRIAVAAMLEEGAWVRRTPDPSCARSWKHGSRLRVARCRRADAGNRCRVRFQRTRRTRDDARGDACRHARRRAADPQHGFAGRRRQPMIDALQARLVRFLRRMMTRPRIDLPLLSACSCSPSSA